MDKIRGVNLGNWLVLEKWMGDSPMNRFDGFEDDHDMMTQSVPEVIDRLLEEHRKSYVTKDTIQWLKDSGCNLLRVPIPYHLFGSEHHRSCSRHLNNLFDWAEDIGINILIDLHTVPMGHNGNDAGGYVGMCRWHHSEDLVKRTVAFLTRVAGRYAGSPVLWGIDPLSEPANKYTFNAMVRKYGRRYPERIEGSTIPTFKFLCQYYTDCYNAIRPITGSDVRMVFHDNFFLRKWSRFMVGPRYENVYMDTHRYPCFETWRTKNNTIEEYVAAVERHAEAIREANQYHPVIVGEWSLGNNAYTERLGVDGQRAWHRKYADAQIDAWDESAGGCFWSLRQKDRGGWSFEDCVKNGWIDLRHGM